MIVATAGHIDHGKTTLVRALTGVDTDCLPEEKRRGMSIDLGFAHRPVAGGGCLTFVDVPGHERFLRNMIAGAAAVDFALVVVAADDGPMPQTLEHLAVIDLLGLRRGAIVVTKCDRVDAVRREAVAREVLALASHTGLGAPAHFAVSSTTGEGIADLLAFLDREAAAPERPAAVGHHFRMTVDKVMSIPGHGTVLAGTAVAGRARVGGIVHLCPAGRKLRIRGLQSAGRAVESVESGQRCAVNVVWKDSPVEIARGDCLVAAAIDRFTDEIGVVVRPVVGASLPVRGSEVQLYLGTASVAGRFRPTAWGGSTAVGLPGFLRLVRPIHALAGDRFVLRGGPAHRVIGGGQVIDPFPRARHALDRRLVFEALSDCNLEEALPRLAMNARHGAPIDPLATLFNVSTLELEALCDRQGIAILGTGPSRIGLAGERYNALCEYIVQSVGFKHRLGGELAGTPQAGLTSPRELRLAPDAMAHTVHLLVTQGQLQRHGSRLLPAGAPPPPANELFNWEQVQQALDQNWPRPARLKDVAARLGTDEPALAELLSARARRGDILRIADRVYATLACGKLLVDAFNQAGGTSGGVVSVATYRDYAGLNRREAVQVLEYFDRVGYTRRRVDGHVPHRLLEDGSQLQPTNAREASDEASQRHG